MTLASSKTHGFTICGQVTLGCDHDWQSPHITGQLLGIRRAIITNRNAHAMQLYAEGGSMIQGMLRY